MSKYLFSFLFIISALNLSAQIQRHFFEFNLGKTTPEEVYGYFVKQKKTIEKEIDNNRIIVHQVKFAGHTWPSVFFHFYNNKLYRIRFAESSNFSTSIKNLDDLQNNIEYVLLSKYEKYLTESTRRKKEYKFFDDGKTMIKCYSEYYGDTKMLGLVYTDNMLFFEKSNKEESEL